MNTLLVLWYLNCVQISMQLDVILMISYFIYSFKQSFLIIVSWLMTAKSEYKKVADVRLNCKRELCCIPMDVFIGMIYYQMDFCQIITLKEELFIITIITN